MSSALPRTGRGGPRGRGPGAAGARGDHRRREGERFGAAVALGKAAAASARGAREGFGAGSGTAADPAARHAGRSTVPTGTDGNSGRAATRSPDFWSVAAGERLERWLTELPLQPLLALVSGGASACAEAPAPGLTLEDLAATQRALLASGLPIQPVNAVRKHLSRLKGGGALLATVGGSPAFWSFFSPTCRGTIRRPSPPDRSPPTLLPMPKRSLPSQGSPYRTRYGATWPPVPWAGSRRP